MSQSCKNFDVMSVWYVLSDDDKTSQKAKVECGKMIAENA